MDSNIGFKGDADVMINQNHGPVTVNNIYQGVAEDQRNSDPIHRVALGKLYGYFKVYNLKPEIEVISATLFGTTIFKELGVDQIKQLQQVAKVINDRLSSLKSGIEEKYDNYDEVDFNNFFKETGMRASTPERFALRLLIKNNVTPSEVKEVRSELLLNFKDDGLLHLRIPTTYLLIGWPLAALSIITLVFAMFGWNFFDHAKQLPPLQQLLAFLLFSTITIGATLFFMTHARKFLRPYYIAKRIKQYVDKVNLTLTER